MTYTVKITPTEMAMLDGYCRAAGRSLKSALGLLLTERAATATATAPAPAAPVAPVAPTPAPEPPCQILTAEESADAFTNSLISLA